MSIMNLNSSTYTLSATTSSSAVTLIPQDALCTSIIVSVIGSGNVFIVSGAASAPTAVFPTSATAPLNGQVVPAGVTMTLTKNEGDVFISGICDASTAKVYIAVGTGE